MSNDKIQCMVENMGKQPPKMNTDILCFKMLHTVLYFSVNLREIICTEHIYHKIKYELNNL